MTYLGGLTKYGVELSNVVKTTVERTGIRRR